MYQKKEIEVEENKNAQNKISVSGDNAYAILSYLWVLCLIPVLMKKDGDFVKFHARQGLVLFIAEIAIAILGIIPFLGGLISTLGILICGLVSILGIIQVLLGNKWEIPVIYDWSKNFNI